MVDTGLDETSCYFADDDGSQVEHGYLYDGVRKEVDGNVSLVLGDYSFAYDMSRRKVGLRQVEVPDGLPHVGKNGCAPTI